MDNQIQYIKVANILPYKNNPRLNEQAIEYVANSIRDFGFKVPIVLDKNNIIVAGHTRWEASKRLGLDEVPCIIASDLTEEQIKKFRIVDNKTGGLATWDLTLLGNELMQLEDFNLTDYGFNEIELLMLTEDIEPEVFNKDMIDSYQDHSASVLKAGRVIIKYSNTEEKAYLEKLIKEKKGCLKVVYRCEEIINRTEE